MCERVGGAGGGADASAPPKTRTPHKDVGEKTLQRKLAGVCKNAVQFPSA